MANKKMTTEEWIIKSRKTHDGKYSYAKSIYKGSKKPITITCPIHGDFQQQAKAHYEGSGCPKCSIEKRVNARKLTTADFIKKSKEVHGDKYDYSKSNYTIGSENITIGCPVHGDFQQLARNHMSGMGCPKCAIGKNTIPTEFKTNRWIEKAKAKHGDKYDYNKVIYFTKDKPVNIICPIHGEFQMLPVSHVNSVTGCPKCSIEHQKEVLKKPFTLTKEIFLAKAKELYGDSVDYSKVNFVDSNTPVTLICKKHGEYEQKPHNHLRNKGCKQCAIENMSNSKKLTTEEFIKRARAKHGDKYDYSKVVYTIGSDYTDIVCSEHGIFKQRADSHLYGYGCPKCGVEKVHKPKINTNEFIEKARFKHGDKYDYSLVDYKGSGTNNKVKIICPKHGIFEQNTTTHLSGTGCPRCSIENRRIPKTSTSEFIEKAKAKHGDKFDYSKVVYAGMYKKITFDCPKHGEVTMLPKSHLTSETGCPKCSRELTDSKQTSSKDVWVAKARLLHGDKYDYSKVNYINKATKVEIICPTHGSFWQIAGEHVRAKARGCKKCAMEATRITKDEFVERAREVHSDRFSYDKVNFKKMTTPIMVTCKEHGDFSVIPNNHLAATVSGGCLKCSTVRTIDEKEFIKRAKEKFGNKFDYSKMNYIGYTSHATIICPLHGKFQQTPEHHIRSKHGCSKCSRLHVSDTEEFVKKAKVIHGNRYNYDKVDYYNSKAPVIITCKEHGDFKQRPNDHLDGHGCPICSSSEAIIKINRFLQDNDIKNIPEYVMPEADNKRLRFDFFLPELNILIEYDGEQHFKSIKKWGGDKELQASKDRDELKNNLAKQHGYYLIRIKYDKFDMLEEYLLFRLSKYFKYRVGNNWYKDFLELCRGENLPGDTKLKDVEKYLIYKKDEK